MWGFGRYEVATVDKDKRAVPAMRTDNLLLATVACEDTPAVGMRPYIFDHETAAFVILSGQRSKD